MNSFHGCPLSALSGSSITYPSFLSNTSSSYGYGGNGALASVPVNAQPIVPSNRTGTSHFASNTNYPTTTTATTHYPIYTSSSPTVSASSQVPINSNTSPDSNASLQLVLTALAKCIDRLDTISTQQQLQNQNQALITPTTTAVSTPIPPPPVRPAVPVTPNNGIPTHLIAWFIGLVVVIIILVVFIAWIGLSLIATNKQLDALRAVILQLVNGNPNYQQQQLQQYYRPVAGPTVPVAYPNIPHAPGTLTSSLL